MTEAQRRFSEDMLSHPVPVEGGKSLTQQHRAAQAVALMWHRADSDISVRSDGRFSVAMPDPIQLIRVCFFERHRNLIVSADDDARCFVLVWETSDLHVLDVRGVVSAKRLREEGLREGDKIIFKESALSLPEALGFEYERWVNLEVEL